MKIGITGGTGFVGSHLVHKLQKQNLEITILAHSKRDDGLLPKNVTNVTGSLSDKPSLEKFCQNIDVLYHLVGIIAETKSKTFEKTVVEGTQNLIDVAKENKVSKVVYLSAIGTSQDALSKYHQTKYIAEQTIIKSQIPYLIFRPSILYGERDGFISMLRDMIRYSPFLPVIGSGKYKMQPLYIDDLVSMMTSVDDINNKIIEVGGPEKLEYLEILSILKKVLGKKRVNFFLPTMLMKIVSSVLEKVVKPAPITRDQILMMEAGSTCDTTEMKKLFRIDPISFEDGLKIYLR